MHDINGNVIALDDEMQLACKVIELLDEGVVVRILNSETELMISCQHDEVLGSIASAELTKAETPVVQPWPGTPVATV